jgi:hypothetical protein
MNAQLLAPRTRVEEAKAKLTIPVLWQMFTLAGKPAKNCRSPFREDRHPSFSVSDDGRYFHDFATGEKGDAIDFYAKIRGIALEQAFLEYLDLAKRIDPGSNTGNGRANSCVKAKKLILEGLRPPTDAELVQISTVRCIPIEGLLLATNRKLLFSYDHPVHGECWLVTDDSRRNAICRKFDGGSFPGDKKSVCLKGSDANWPIGIAQAKKYRAIALTEGAPDFLAAFWLAYAGAVEDLVAPVCMTSAGCSIHSDALPLFHDKQVRIFTHADAAGALAAARWAEQLRTVQAAVDGFAFGGLHKTDGSSVKDLNDFILATGPQGGGIELLTGAFDFALERWG